MSKGRLFFYALFVLSLAVNVFIMGWFVGGRGMVHPVPQARSLDRVEFSVRRLARHLDPEARRELRAKLRSERVVLKDRIRLRREAEKDVHDLLLQPEVDLEALAQAMARQASADRSLRDPFRQIILEIVAYQPLDVRQAIVADLFRAHEARQDRRPPAG